MKNNTHYDFPSIGDARKRSKEKINIERELFNIPAECRGLGNGRNYFLRTYGCQANQRDSETIAGILEELGYAACDNENEADLILLNTCAIRKNAEDKVLGEIGNLKKLKRSNPDLIIAMSGCMAQEEGIVNEILKKYPQVDLIFGTHNIYNLPKLLFNATVAKEKTVEVFSKEGEIIEALPSSRFMHHKAWVNISYGCDKFCTYCIVPYTRGKERSRLIQDIIAEVKDLKEHGYKEVCLLGQNVNAYGRDLDLQNGFAKLLEEVAITGIERVRFMTSHPWNFDDETIDVCAKYSNIMPYIHLPLQSGNDEILRRMNRRYNSNEYRILFDKLKKAIPGCAFTTDIIVGFPNESNEAFEDTLKMVDYCQYDNAFTFIYSPREGTPAAMMEDNVEMHIKEERLAILNEKVAHYANLNNQKYLNQTVEVLIDGVSKKNDRILSGYTRDNKLVNFTGNAKAGDIVNVRITAVKSFSLDGEMIEE